MKTGEKTGTVTEQNSGVSKHRFKYCKSAQGVFLQISVRKIYNEMFKTQFSKSNVKNVQFVKGESFPDRFYIYCNFMQDYAVRGWVVVQPYLVLFVLFNSKEAHSRRVNGWRKFIKDAILTWS